MMTAAAAKYVAFVRMAAIQASRERGELYGRVAFFAVILGVFSSLWRAVAEAGMPIATDPHVLVWYLAATEWIVLSAPPIHIDVQESVRRGDVVCQLGRPISFVGAAFAEGVGVLLVRSCVLAVAAFACAWWFTGSVPPLGVFVLVVPFGLIASTLLTALHLWIGLLAFWLHDVSPIYWVLQKLMFILGGLMLPIQLYPDVIQRIAAWTPFPSMLAGPASFVLPAGHVGAGMLGRNLAIWCALAALAVYGLSRRVISSLTINGG